MPLDYLHNHPEFSQLIAIVAAESKIDPFLVEKDYWIMHCLYGLQQAGFTFELKGGTSLSKGFCVVDRFSEDIDIRIEPPADMDVKTGRNQDRPAQVESRKQFYDWLASTLQINGISKVTRDHAFDDAKYRSGGIRLHYPYSSAALAGVKDGVLLEVGFDDITPNTPTDISSWAYDYAAAKVEIIDNRALGVLCYNPGYTLVEKIQALSTKYRRQQEGRDLPKNFMRHYYDVYRLLQQPDIQRFIGTKEYLEHKERRFRTADNPVIATNEAFLLRDDATRQLYAKAYDDTKALYYRNRPSFNEIIEGIRAYVDRL
jgi:hypothetical protein